MPTAKEIKAKEHAEFKKMIESSESFKKWKAMRQAQESAGKLKPPKLGYFHAYMVDISKKAELDMEKWKKKLNTADIEGVDYPPKVKAEIKEMLKKKEIPPAHVTTIFMPKEKVVAPPSKAVIDFITVKGKSTKMQKLPASKIGMSTLSECSKIEIVDAKGGTHTLPKVTPKKIETLIEGVHKGFVKSIKCIL
jgi:hypothetical protein